MKVWKKFIISLLTAITFLVTCLLLYPHCKAVETTYLLTVWVHIFLYFTRPGFLWSVGAVAGSFFCMKAGALMQKICKWLVIAVLIGYSIMSVIIIASDFSLGAIQTAFVWAAYHPVVFVIPGFLLCTTLSGNELDV